MAEINNPLTRKTFIPLAEVQHADGARELKFSGDIENREKENRKKLYNMIFSGLAVICLIVVLLVSAHNRKYRTTSITDSTSLTKLRSSQAIDNYKNSLTYKLCRGNKC